MIYDIVHTYIFIGIWRTLYRNMSQKAKYHVITLRLVICVYILHFIFMNSIVFLILFHSLQNMLR